MIKDYIPNTDAAFVAWFGDFISVATTNATTLGLTSAELEAMTTAKSNVSTTLSAANAAHAAAKAATQAKTNARAASNALVRSAVRRIQANPAVSDTLKWELGIPVHQGPSGPLVPVPPAGLEAVPHANAVNTLKWRANGNAPGGVYVVQVSVTNSGVWTEVTTCTKTRFDHTGVTLGQPLTYRVCARRGTVTSAPSNEASVYTKQTAAAEPVAAETVTDATVLLLPTEKAA